MLFRSAWIGVLGVAVAVILWNVGVSLVGVPVASLFSNSAPVFAIGAAALMGSAPSWLQLGGGALVLGEVITREDILALGFILTAMALVLTPKRKATS